MDQQASEAAAAAAIDEHFGDFDERLTDCFEQWRNRQADLVGFARRWVLQGYIRRDIEVLVSMVAEDFTHRTVPR